MLVLAIVYSECLYEQCDELLYKVEGERRQGEQNPAVCGRVLRHLLCLTIRPRFNSSKISFVELSFLEKFVSRKFRFPKKFFLVDTVSQ